MTYTFLHVQPQSQGQEGRRSVLVIYTGGTFGMVFDPHRRQLVPFDFERVLEQLPELNRLSFRLSFVSLSRILDSSNMTPDVWIELAQLIEATYNTYDSFVILHGTDTMAYTASALSFMLKNLSKPVVLTGAQLPIGVARSDARENFITALEIAAAVDTAAVDTAAVGEDDRPMVPEVCIYFHGVLLRGNRSTKQESIQFNAFASENYPQLATAGVSIDYNRPYIHRPETVGRPLQIETRIDANVLILKLFPGITPAVTQAMLTMPGLRGVVLETYGAGNAPMSDWFIQALREAVGRGVVLFNVSQCEGGRVTQGHYETSRFLADIGVISGADITTEAAITKLMLLLGCHTDPARIGDALKRPMAGEMTE